MKGREYKIFYLDSAHYLNKAIGEAMNEISSHFGSYLLSGVSFPGYMESYIYGDCKMQTLRSFDFYLAQLSVGEKGETLSKI